MLTADCQVTTTTDDDHVLVEATTAEGLRVQLILTERAALEHADDLTVAAESIRRNQG